MSAIRATSPSSTSDRINLLEENDQIRNENNYTPSGEKVKSHGITYHDHVIMLYLCKFMMKDNFSFNLTCEVIEGGKFDDIMIFYVQDNRVLCRMIQVKSKTNTSNTLTRTMLVDRSEPFDLNTYFLSYLEIMVKHNFEAKFKCEIKDLILHTNIDVGQELKEDLEMYEDELLKLRRCFRLKNGQSDFKTYLTEQLLESVCNEISKREGKIKIIKSKQNKKMTARQQDIINEEEKYIECLKHLTVDDRKKRVDIFLEKLKFHVKQPNKDELADLIKREIKRCLKKYNLETVRSSNQSVIVYTGLYNKVYTFHSDPKVTVLTDKQLVDWLKEGSRCSMTRLAAFHDMNMNLLTSHGFFVGGESVERLKANIECNRDEFLNIIANAGTVFTLIKLNDIFKGKKYNLITEQQFLTMSRTIEDDIDIEKTEHLIITCEDNVTTNLLFNIEDLLDRIRDESEGVCKDLKKIILVSKGGENQSNEMLTDQTEWNDLRKDTRKRIEGKNTICLQGREVNLADIGISNFSDSLNNEILYDIVYSTITLGKPIDGESTCDNSNFVERRISLQNKISKNIFRVDSKNDIFIVCNINETEFQQLASSAKCQLVFSDIVNSQNVFLNLCSKHTHGNVTLLRHENDEFFCQESKSIDRLLPHVNGNSPWSIELRHLTDIDNRTVLIIAEPGMGKSDLLTVLASRLIKETPRTLVVKINLNNCTKEFNKLLTEERTFTEQSEAIDFIVETQLYNTEGYKSSFERSYFKRHFSLSDGIFILLDGFDEIAPDYREVVIDLVKLIQDISSVRLWLTSRPQEKKYLETELNTLSYALVRFTTEDQNNFFLAYWNRRETEDDQNARLKKFVERLINVTSKSLRDNDQLMTGIPLQCRMLGEVYHGTFEQYFNSEQDDVEAYLPESLDILELYDKFIEKKRIIYDEEKSKRDLTVISNKIQSSIDSGTFHKTHSYFGLCAVFMKAHLDDILSEKDREKMDKYVREVESGNEKTGIIHIVENRTPSFIHKTFAEYFAARWLYYRIKVDGPDRRTLVDFFKKHLFKSEFEMVRRFFDRLSAKGELFKAILNDDEKYLIKILETDPALVDSLADFDRTPLHLCAMYEYNNLIRILIDRRVQSMTEDSLCGWKPIEYACAVRNWKNVDTFLAVNADDDETAYKCIEDKNILFDATGHAYLNLIKYLIKCGTSVNSVNNKNESSLHLAARKGNFDVCKYLIEEAGASVYINDEDGDSVLHYAVRGGDLAIVKMLIREKSDVNVVNKKGCTPLHSAAYFGHYEVFKYLIADAEASIDVLDVDGDSVLHYACRGGNKNIVKMLIDANVNVNISNNKKCTPLHSAAFFNKYDVLEYLISETGANVYARDIDEDTVLHYAARGGNEDIASLLIKAKVDPNVKNKKGCTPLHSAAYFGKYIVLKYLVQKVGVKIDVRDLEGDSVLHYTSRGGNVHIAEFLWREGLNFDVVNDKGCTPLQSAAFFGHYDMFRYLVKENKIKIDRKDNDGDSILHYACRGGNINIVKLLIKKKIDVNVKNNFGQIPLHSAAFFNRLDVFKYLLERTCADIEIRDKDNDSVLHYAARGGSIDIVKLIVEANVDVNITNYKMVTPLHSAAYFGHHEVLKYLIQDANARTDIYDQDGDSALHYAARHGNLLSVKVLIENKFDVNFVNEKGCPPAFSAAYFGKYDILKYLIEEANAKIDGRDKNGDSILHHGVVSGNIDIVKMLIAETLNVNVENKKGTTPLDCAKYRGYLDIVKYFTETFVKKY